MIKLIFKTNNSLNFDTILTNTATRTSKLLVFPCAYSKPLTDTRYHRHFTGSFSALQPPVTSHRPASTVSPQATSGTGLTPMALADVQQYQRQHKQVQLWKNKTHHIARSANIPVIWWKCWAEWVTVMAVKINTTHLWHASCHLHRNHLHCFC